MQLESETSRNEPWVTDFIRGVWALYFSHFDETSPAILDEGHLGGVQTVRSKEIAVDFSCGATIAHENDRLDHARERRFPLPEARANSHQRRISKMVMQGKAW